MAVATLERPTEHAASEAEHNAAIRENYLRLINPESTIDDLIGDASTKTEQASAAEASARTYAAYNDSLVRRTVDNGMYDGLYDASYMRAPVHMSSAAVVTPAESYANQGGITESEVFRADNPMYKKYFDENQNVLFPMENYPVADEDADIRPTDNTIRYRTIGTTSVSDETAEETSSSNEDKTGSKFRFGIEIGKRERTIIGTFIGIVVALFVLVIVNSVVISGLNKEIDSASENVQVAMDRYEQASDNLAAAMDSENVYNYALENGMTYVGTNK